MNAGSDLPPLLTGMIWAWLRIQDLVDLEVVAETDDDGIVTSTLLLTGRRSGQRVRIRIEDVP